MPTARDLVSLQCGEPMLELLFTRSIMELANALNVFEDKTGLDANLMPEFEGAHALIRLYILWTVRHGRDISFMPGLLKEEGFVK